MRGKIHLKIITIGRVVDSSNSSYYLYSVEMSELNRKFTIMLCYVAFRKIVKKMVACYWQFYTLSAIPFQYHVPSRLCFWPLYVSDLLLYKFHEISLYIEYTVAVYICIIIFSTQRFSIDTFLLKNFYRIFIFLFFISLGNVLLFNAIFFRQIYHLM